MAERASGLATPCVAVRLGCPTQKRPTSNLQMSCPGVTETPDCPTVIRMTGDRAVHFSPTSNVVLDKRLERLARLRFALSQKDNMNKVDTVSSPGAGQWWLSALPCSPKSDKLEWYAFLSTSAAMETQNVCKKGTMMCSTLSL